MNEIILQQIKANLCVKTTGQGKAKGWGTRDVFLGGGRRILVTGNAIRRQTNKSENGTERNENRPTNKQTNNETKTAASKSERRGAFLQRNLSKALCNKVRHPGYPLFAHLPLKWGLTGIVLHLYTSRYIYIFLFPIPACPHSPNQMSIESTFHSVG